MTGRFLDLFLIVRALVVCSITSIAGSLYAATPQADAIRKEAIKCYFWAIEVKSGERLKEADFFGLNAFAEEFPSVRKTLVARVAAACRRPDGIEILPVDEFLQTSLGI